MQLRHLDAVCTIPKQTNRQGGASAVDLPARSFDLARPGVATPLSADSW